MALERQGGVQKSGSFVRSFTHTAKPNLTFPLLTSICLLRVRVTGLTTSFQTDLAVLSSLNNTAHITARYHIHCTHHGGSRHDSW